MFEELEYNDVYPDGNGYGTGFDSLVIKAENNPLIQTNCTGHSPEPYNDFFLEIFDAESFQRIMDV